MPTRPRAPKASKGALPSLPPPGAPPAGAPPAGLPAGLPADDADLLRAAQAAAGLSEYAMATYVYHIAVSTIQSAGKGRRPAPERVREIARAILKRPALVDQLAPGVRSAAARRRERPAAILAALDAGGTAPEVARAHDVTPQYVEQLAAEHGYVAEGAERGGERDEFGRWVGGSQAGRWVGPGATSDVGRPEVGRPDATLLRDRPEV